MTTLVAAELISTLEQEITIERRLDVERFRLYLLKHNNNTGTLTLNVKRGATTVGTANATISDISTSDYFHGYVSFIFTDPVTFNPGTFTIELTSSGYTYSSSQYIGWCILYENVPNRLTDTPTTDFHNPYTSQIWAYERKVV